MEDKSSQNPMGISNNSKKEREPPPYNSKGTKGIPTLHTNSITTTTTY
jgi:hypothetical protein